jgi:DNA-binding transcriptional MocR family regulator
MESSFARRMQSVTASEIREILKVTERPGIISFAGGLPAPELFPTREIAALTAEILERDGAKALQYSTTEGFAPLREQVAARMRAQGAAGVDADRVLVTAGSQQGLDLAGKLFLDDGDAIACESPTYLGAIQAFTIHRPRFVEIRTDEDGLDPADLERRLAAGERLKFVYVVPDFQNPTGRSWTAERRRAFLDVCARHELPVLEDNPYGELRFEGEALPSLLALDRAGVVIALGTLSKVFCPGMRIGWVVASPDMLRRFVLLKQGTDLHTGSLVQRQASAFIERHGLDDTIARLRKVYRGRRDAMLAAIAREFPAAVRVNRPQGGLFLWAELPDGMDGRAVLKRALEHDVAFVPGAAFFPNGGHENTMRLNFSTASEERIAEGIARLGAVLREFLVAAA